MDDRYARQTVIPEIGSKGQARLRQSRVLVVGAAAVAVMLWRRKR